MTVYRQFGPAAFAPLTTEERSALPPINFLTVANIDSNTLETFTSEWMKHALYVGAEHDGDVLSWNGNLQRWNPSSDVKVIGTLTGKRIFTLADDTAAFEARRTFRSLAKTGTGSGGMLTFGDHTHTADKSYRVVIDTAGTDEQSTFKWSDDGGATFKATLQPVSITNRLHLQQGVFIIFTSGTFVLNDRWDFVALGTLTTQTYTFKVDTTNNRVHLADEFTLSYDDALGIAFIVGFSGSTSLQMNQLDGITLLTFNGYVTLSPLARVQLETWAGTGAALQFLERAALVPDANGHATLYAKDVGGVTLPMWNDGTTETSLLSTSAHPLNTGDPHTQYPLAAAAETISGAWGFSQSVGLNAGASVGGTITVSTDGGSTLTLSGGLSLANGDLKFSGTLVLEYSTSTPHLGIVGGDLNLDHAGGGTALIKRAGTTIMTLGTGDPRLTVTGTLLVNSVVQSATFWGTTQVICAKYVDVLFGTERITLAAASPNLVFTGDARLTGFLDFNEYNTTTDPVAPADNRARLYARDNGAGKEQLCVRFATGAVVVLATEP